MTPLTNYHIAVPTSFYDDETLNVEATIAHIQYLHDLGIKSVLVCASTGEQHSLTLNEKLILLDHLSDLNVKDDFDLIFGVASIRQIEAEQLASKINQTSHVKTILIGYSPYILPSQTEALRYTTSIIEHADKRAIIYNNPLRTGFDLSIPSISSLAKHNLITGIKEAGNPEKVFKLNQIIDKPFNYYAGGEIDLASKLELGYNSLSSIAGNLYPIEVKRWLNSMLNEKPNTSDFRSLEANIAKIFKNSPLPYIKGEISRKENINFGICRTPLGN